MFLALRALFRRSPPTVLHQHSFFAPQRSALTSGDQDAKWPPISVAPFVRNVRAVLNKAEKEGLHVRPDGFVSIAELKKCGPFPSLAMPTLEPELHSMGNNRNRLVWWVRKTKRRVPKGMDQADSRLKPDTAVRNAIYKATLSEWENIRKNGIRPPPGKGFISMSPIDKIDETSVDNTPHVYVFVDMEAAIQGGVEFYFTRYLRIMSPGDEDGVILPKYFQDAVEVLIERKPLRPSG